MASSFGPHGRGSRESHGGGVADLMTLQVSYTLLAKIPVRLEPNFLTLTYPSPSQPPSQPLRQPLRQPPSLALAKLLVISPKLLVVSPKLRQAVVRRSATARVSSPRRESGSGG